MSCVLINNPVSVHKDISPHYPILSDFSPRIYTAHFKHIAGSLQPAKICATLFKSLSDDFTITTNVYKFLKGENFAAEICTERKFRLKRNYSDTPEMRLFFSPLPRN